MSAAGPAGPTAAASPAKQRKRRPRRHPVLRATRIVAGCLLVLIGALFGFVPFIPGWILGVAGLSLLSTEIRSIRLVFVLTRRRFRQWRRRRARR